MPLDKQILKQIPDIRKEIKDLEWAIVSVEKKIEKLRQSEVSDIVKGSKEDLTIGPIRVKGHPEKEYGKRLKELKHKKKLLDVKKDELLSLETKAEEYIQTIPDSSTRRIVRYRCIDNLSWQQVAIRMGIKYSSDACRKKFERLFEN